MKSFLLRVELHHDTKPHDYNNLHIALYAIEFYRTILLSDNKWYDLPHAEYIKHSNIPLQTIRGQVCSAVERAIPGILKANKATREQKSYSLTLAESDWDEVEEAFKTKYILYRSDAGSVLPPGKTLR